MFQQLVGIDDRHHLVVAFAAQRGGEQRQRSLLLRGAHIADLEAIAFLRAHLHGNTARKVRPHRARRRIELDIGLRPLCGIEGCQERVGCRDYPLRRRCGALQAVGCAVTHRCRDNGAEGQRTHRESGGHDAETARKPFCS